MNRGFIGLDNPAFHGNIRTKRRHQTEKDLQRKVSPVGLFDDVNEKTITSTITAAQQPVVLKKSPVIPKSPTHQEFVEPIVLKQSPTPKTLQPIPEFPVASTSEKPSKINTAEKKNLRQRIPNITMMSVKNIFTMKFALPAMAVLIFFIGCGVALQGVLTNRHVKAQVANSSSSENPNSEESGLAAYDESDPDQNSAPYVVPANMPKYIRINKIDITKRISKVSVEANNELAVPKNIHTVGWYQGSGLPGDGGTALMVAHVHGLTMPGAFYKIHKLVAGDDVEIEMGDGRKFQYEVVSSESQPYQSVDMNKAMRSATPGMPGLNLITCGGKYNKDTKMYEERVIVYAVQK